MTNVRITDDESVSLCCCVCSQGQGQLEEVEDSFQEQTGRQTQTGQLDIIDTLTRGDGQRLFSPLSLDGSPHTTVQTHSNSVDQSCTHTHSVHTNKQFYRVLLSVT